MLTKWQFKPKGASVFSPGYAAGVSKMFPLGDSLFYWHNNHSDRYLRLLFYGVTFSF